jgi:hypothetical protein
MRSALLLLAAGAWGCGTTDGPPAEVGDPGAVDAVATAHTTRLPAPDAERQAIAITEAVYAATRVENAAGAVILTPQDPRIAFTAMHRITHMPVNAPLLYLSEDGQLGPETLRELARLRPDGVVQDGHTKVYLVGSDDQTVLRRLRDDLGYEVRVFPQRDPIALSEALDRWQAALKADFPDEVVVSAVDHPDGLAHGMGAMGWNAHMGKGFAWVHTDEVPEETRRILERRQREAYIYLTGPEDVISEDVAVELSRYGPVRRIAGADVYDTNVVNAGYKDFGRNFGFWVGWTPRDFGWGLAQSGHNFIVADADQPLRTIPAALLGHMGKHGPILLVRSDGVPQTVRDYLEMVRPNVAGPQHTILNHAWIIGDLGSVSWDVQREVDLLLRADGAPEAVVRAEEAR